jgi:Xaa-Pro dipeptidase
MIMNRRNFIRNAGAACTLVALTPTLSFSKEPASLLDTGEEFKKRIKPITPEERKDRIEQAKRLLHDNNMDALLMEGGTSLHYFAGVNWGRSERLFSLLIPREGEPFFIAPKFEEGRAKEQVGAAKLYTWEEHESPFELIRTLLKDKNMLSSTLGIEETTRYFVTAGIAQAIPTLKISSGTAISAGCRSIKSAHEIELMQVANDMTREVFSAAILELKEGMTEAAFGKIISSRFSAYGVQGGALVLFGEASAYPHGLVKENKLKAGDIVLVDGGCSVEGYESDITRTTVFGKPTEKMKKVWEIVRKAQDAALHMAKPGVEAQGVDAAARKIMEQNGYGAHYEYFTHRLGHGIGMDGHEWYYLVGGNKRLLQAGNMFSNEPGIYIPGEFGIRLEDELLITPEGSRLLLPQAQSLDVIF